MDPTEPFTNRSYRGKTVRAGNRTDMQAVLDTKARMPGKPIVAVVKTGLPVVMAEFEGAADAILVDFGVQQQAVMDIISGRHEPSALLPMQMPADMRTVEEQAEDVPRDMTPYHDADGHDYDFAFGMNWKGVIQDERVAKYK